MCVCFGPLDEGLMKVGICVGGGRGAQSCLSLPELALVAPASLMVLEVVEEEEEAAAVMKGSPVRAVLLT